MHPLITQQDNCDLYKTKFLNLWKNICEKILTVQNRTFWFKQIGIIILKIHVYKYNNMFYLSKNVFKILQVSSVFIFLFLKFLFEILLNF